MSEEREESSEERGGSLTAIASAAMIGGSTLGTVVARVIVATLGASIGNVILNAARRWAPKSVYAFADQYDVRTEVMYAWENDKDVTITNIQAAAGLTRWRYLPLANKWRRQSSDIAIMTFKDGTQALVIYSMPTDALSWMTGIWVLKKDSEKFKKFFEKAHTTFGIRGNRIRDYSAHSTFDGKGRPSANWVMNGSRSIPVRQLNELPLNSSNRKSAERYLKHAIKNWSSPDKANRRKTFNLAFFGEPGTGKTSVAYALATELTGLVYQLPTDLSRADYWTVLPKVGFHSIILADEADSAPIWQSHVSAEQVSNPMQRLISHPDISDALASLTGPRVVPATSIIIISNKPGLIDPRAYREGRVFDTVYFKPVDDEGVRYYLTHYHKLKVPKDFKFVEDKTTAQIIALEEKLDDPMALMLHLRVGAVEESPADTEIKKD